MAKASRMPPAKKAKAKSKKPTDRPVLSMTAKQARAFFLKPESYCRIEFPPYFDFGRVLRSVADFIRRTPLSSASEKPQNHEVVNYTIYSN